MASIISAGTTSGTALNLSGDTSGVLQLATNGTTTAITIGTDQKVGIGTTTLTNKFNVAGAIASTSTLAAIDANSVAMSQESAYSRIAAFGADSSTAGTLYLYTISTNGGIQNGAIIDPSGNLLVGTTTYATTPTQGMTVANSTSASVNIGHTTGTPSGYLYVNFGYNAGQIGSITQNGTTAVAYNTTSDYRLKENIAPLTGALARITALKPVTYTWKTAPDEMGEGFIAHELAEVCPQAVTGEKDEIDKDGNPKYQGIDTSFLVATLTAALQETKALLDTQAATITALTARIVALETV